MPIYDYRCVECGRLSSVFVRSITSVSDPSCESCGSRHLLRAPAKFAYHRSEQGVLERYGVPGPYARPEDYKDPRQIGRWVEQRFGEMGLDLPSEARTMIDAARAGELPEPVRDL